MSNKPELHIDWATHKAAKYACENWHYSKSVPVPPLVKVGVWEDSLYIGCVIFGRGANHNMGKTFNLRQDECVELVRVALTKHITEVTRIVSIAIKFLKKANPALRLIVSYADPEQGHMGGIYQAGNWIYTGDTAQSKEYWKNGKRLHSRQVSEKGWNIQQGVKIKTAKPSECEIVKTKGKHRYVMPLDKEMRKKVISLSKPYPKKQSSVDSSKVEQLAIQQEEGGAVPTSTLHFTNQSKGRFENGEA